MGRVILSRVPPPSLSFARALALFKPNVRKKNLFLSRSNANTMRHLDFLQKEGVALRRRARLRRSLYKLYHLYLFSRFFKRLSRSRDSVSFFSMRVLHFHFLRALLLLFSRSNFPESSIYNILFRIYFPFQAYDLRNVLIPSPLFLALVPFPSEML